MVKIEQIEVNSVKLVIVLDNFNTRINNSSEIRSKKTMRKILLDLKNKYKEYDELAINKMSIDSMVREWSSHNLLCYLNIKTNRTCDVDLNIDKKWYYKIGYFIGSILYFHY